VKDKRKHIQEKRIQELELFVQQLQAQVLDLRGIEKGVGYGPSTEPPPYVQYSDVAYRDYLNSLYPTASDTMKDHMSKVHATPWNSDDEFAEHVAYNRLKDFGMEDAMPRPQSKGPMAFINNMRKATGLNEVDFIEFTEQLQKQAADTPVNGPVRNPVFMRDDEWLKITHDITNGPRRNSYSHPLRNFLRIAIRWSVNHETVITPLQVAQDMVEMKMARSQSSFKDDDWIDTMGYSNTVQMMNDKLIELGYQEGVKIFEGIGMPLMWELLMVCVKKGVGK
jgi:hypothetical protein